MNNTHVLCLHPVARKDGPTTPDINATAAMVGGGVGGGLGLLLILFLVVGGCCIWRKKKRSAQTSDAETYTNADRLEVTREVTTTTTTKGTITIFPRFK